jgi:dimeric dUTPase (all-alpha-NTP-PPase superfamily)
MILKIAKKELTENILSPVSKLCDNAIIEFTEIKIGDASKYIVKTKASSSDESIVFIGRAACEVDAPLKCVVPDCKTFLRMFAGTEKDLLTLHINGNYIEFQDSLFSFKYHLLDESYAVSKKNISEDKIDQLAFDTKFRLSKSKINELIKYNSIIPDVEKLYLYTQGTAVMAKIGDEVKSNTNEIVVEIASAFEGVPIVDKIALNIQNLVLFCFSGDEIVVHINHKLKIIKFETPKQKYIISGLVK